MFSPPYPPSPGKITQESFIVQHIHSSVAWGSCRILRTTAEVSNNWPILYLIICSICCDYGVEKSHDPQSCEWCEYNRSMCPCVAFGSLFSQWHKKRSSQFFISQFFIYFSQITVQTFFSWLQDLKSEL